MINRRWYLLQKENYVRHYFVLLKIKYDDIYEMFYISSMKKFKMNKKQLKAVIYGNFCWICINCTNKFVFCDDFYDDKLLFLCCNTDMVMVSTILSSPKKDLVRMVTKGKLLD